MKRKRSWSLIPAVMLLVVAAACGETDNRKALPGPTPKATTTGSTKPAAPTARPAIPGVAWELDTTGSPLLAGVLAAKSAPPAPTAIWTGSRLFSRNAAGHVVEINPKTGKVLWEGESGALLAADKQSVAVVTIPDFSILLLDVASKKQVARIKPDIPLSPTQLAEYYRWPGYLLGNKIIVPHVEIAMGTTTGFTMWDRTGKKLGEQAGEIIDVFDTTLVVGSENEIYLFDTIRASKQQVLPAHRSGATGKWAYARAEKYVAAISPPRPYNGGQEFTLTVADLTTNGEIFKTPLRPGRFDQTVSKSAIACILHCKVNLDQLQMTLMPSESQPNRRNLYMWASAFISGSGINDPEGGFATELDLDAGKLRGGDPPQWGVLPTRFYLGGDNTGVMFSYLPDSGTTYDFLEKPFTFGNSKDTKKLLHISIQPGKSVPPRHFPVENVPAAAYLGESGEHLIFASWNEQISPKAEGGILAISGVNSETGKSWSTPLNFKTTRLPGVIVRPSQIIVVGDSAVRIDPKSGQVSLLASIGKQAQSVFDTGEVILIEIAGRLLAISRLER